MSERLKLIIRLTLFSVITVMLSAVVYILFFRGAPSISDDTDTTTEDLQDQLGSLIGSGDADDRETSTGDTTTDDDEDDGRLELSQVADGGRTLTVQLTASRITEPTITSSNSIAYYDPIDGRFYTIDGNGNVVALSDTQFPQAEEVTFGGDAEKVAIEFPDGSNVIYDFATETQTTLPEHWEEFEFSDDAEDVVTKNITSDPGANTLVITSSDGSQAKSVAHLGAVEEEFKLTWSPHNNIVAFAETGTAQSGFGRQEIYLIDESGETVATIVVDGSNFSSMWSPTGEYLLYSVASGSRLRPALWWTNGRGTIGSERSNLELETWVEKCTFADQDTVYCGVPQEMKDFSGHEPDLIDSGDDLYKIDLNTGAISYIATPATDMQMWNLWVSDDGKTLFFTDAQGRLNSMRLK